MNPGQGSISPRRISQTAIILNGGTASAVISLSTSIAVGFLSPPGWTSGSLTVYGSVDGGLSFKPIVDEKGLIAATWSNISPDYLYVFQPYIMLGWDHIQFVSGVAQGADRTFVVISRPSA